MFVEQEYLEADDSLAGLASVILCGREGKLQCAHFNVRSKINRGILKMLTAGASLVVQWLKLCLPMQRVKIQSLVRELRSTSFQAKKPKHKTEAVL